MERLVESWFLVCHWECGCFRAAAWETELGPSSRQSTEALRSLSFLVAVFVVRTWNLVHYFFYASYLAVTFPVCGVLLLEYSIGFFGRFFGYSCALFLVRQWIHVLHQYWAFGRIAHFFYVAADSNPDCVSFPIGLNGEECPVDASGCSVAPGSSHLEHWTFFSSFTWLTPVMMVWNFRRIFTAFFGLFFGVEALPIHPEVRWTYTLAHMSLNNNNNNRRFSHRSAVVVLTS